MIPRCVPCVLLPVVLAAGVLAARGAVAQDGGALGRVSEPVIVAGGALRPLIGLPTDHVGVWIWSDTEWNRIPSQIDQRDASGLFVADEDANTLDADDELVLMADALGTRADLDADWPDFAAVGKWAEVTVSDPLDPAAAGYGYVFENVWEREWDPLVAYDAATRVIHSDAYTIGLATADVDGFVGLKSLSLMGDPRNRIDRTKIRVSVPTLGDFNEETLATFGGVPALEPVIQGPVRLVMNPTGGAVAYPARASLFDIALGIDVPLIPGLEFRVSLDLNSNAVGATYRDAYSLRDIAIDGAPDTVQQLLVPPWRQVTFEEGRLVMLATGPATPLLVRNYYKDDAAPDTADTGDQMSYGDSGVSASSFAELAAVGFLGQMVAVAPDQTLTAAQLAEHLANPLQVAVTLSGSALYLPSLHQVGAR